jgi:hypothetical protein
VTAHSLMQQSLAAANAREAASWLEILDIKLTVCVSLVAASFRIRHAQMDTTDRAPGRAQRGRCTSLFWPPAEDDAEMGWKGEASVALTGWIKCHVLALLSERWTRTVEIRNGTA